MLAFLIAQAVLVSRITIGEIAPDFMLLLVVLIALNRNAVTGAVLGFIVGFFQDLTNPELLGLNAMLKSIVGFMSGRAGAKTSPENIIFLFALFVAIALGHDLVYLMIYMWPNVGGAFGATFLTALPSALYTGVIGVFMNRLVGTFGKKVVTVFGKEGQQ